MGLGYVAAAAAADGLDVRFALQVVVPLLPIDLVAGTGGDLAVEQAALVGGVEEGLVDLVPFKDAVLVDVAAVELLPEGIGDAGPLVLAALADLVLGDLAVAVGVGHGPPLVGDARALHCHID